MLKHFMLAGCVLGIALAMTWGFPSFAGDKTPAASSCCAKACKGTLTGKVEVKTEKVAGKDVKAVYINATACKSADGKAMCNMAGGKTIKVVGPEVAQLEKLNGKTVELKGVCKAGKEFEAASVAEKAATSKK